MNYQVWIKHEFDESWDKVDCGDLEEVKRELESSLRAGAEPLVTVEVPYTMSIKVQEVGSEATPRKTKQHQGAGSEGDSEVRRGDESPPEPVGEGTGNSEPGPSAKDRK